MGEVFSHRFDPILLPNQTAVLFGSDFPADGQPVRCRAVGSLPEYIKDWGSLTAGTWTSDQNDTNLEMPSQELAQYRIKVLDDFKVRLKHPPAVGQWKVLNTYFELHRYPESESDIFKDYIFRASEFFVYEDTTPRFDLFSRYALTVSRLWFGGYRLKLEKINRNQLTSQMEIWVDGWPGGK